MASQLGARKNGKFKAVSTAPSINKTPVGNSTPPLPYPVTEDLSSSVGTVSNVRFNGDPAYVLSQSTQPSCKGDAAGSCKGVKSGTVSGEVKPVQGSGTVRIAGKPIIREGDPCTLNAGNCPGIYVTQPAPGASIEGGQPTSSGNPPVKPETPEEENWWGKTWDTASPWVHGALGVASFVPGLGTITGAADAGIYAAEGDMVEAGMAAASMIPGGKIVTAAGKVVKGAAGLAKGAHAAEEAAKLAKEAEAAANAAKLGRAEEAAKLQKIGDEAAEAKKAETASGTGKGKDGVKVKGKKKLKCGEYGKYGDLKKKTGDGKFDRDHIPSKAALKKRATSLLGKDRRLSPARQKAIEDWGDSIAIPRQAHIDISPTYGARNLELAPRDAQDLSGAARRDVETMLKQIDEYDADGGCKKAYQKAAKRILRMSNEDFDRALLDILKKVK
jgi:uncharacterized Zn-binding protein involved in type VI secretion